MDTSSILKIALVIEQRDLVDSELRSRILSAMDRLKIETKACSILIDYSETDFENPDIVSAIIEGTYEDIQTIGDWESIVFQGTSIPRKNPANHKSSVLLPRNEWIAWKKAVDFSPSLLTNLYLETLLRTTLLCDLGNAKCKQLGTTVMHFQKNG